MDQKKKKKKPQQPNKKTNKQTNKKRPTDPDFSLRYGKQTYFLMPKKENNENF